jgi:hypothetical protein
VIARARPGLRLMPAVTLVAGPLMLKQRAAHLVQVAGDHGVQARARAAPVACGDDGDAVPCLLRGELVPGELGRELAQLRRRAGHATHGLPAGIMTRLAPRRSAVAPIASLSRRRA